MKSILFFISFIFLSPILWSQSLDTIKPIDSLYKEDQFYIGVTYNLLGKTPSGLSQSGFSSGFHFGYIKDMPINIKRNRAIGIGIGISLNSFNQNMLISEAQDKSLNFNILDDSETPFTKNKFSTYMLEVPMEYRWRTSSATDYSFWRIYTGVKLGYVFASNSKFEGSAGNIKLSNIDEFNNFQYGLSLSAGYNTWNFHIYYGLNPIFKSEAKVNGEDINTNAIKIGLMFYIL